MPKNSDNLNLTLYDSSADSARFSQKWFDDNFGYNNSNLVKIDTAYKEQQGKIDNTPTKNGIGATGTWSIDISGSANSAAHDGAGNDINSTYISEISVEDTSVTYTKGNGGSQSLSFKTDKTLTKEGMIADAKSVGDTLASMKIETDKTLTVEDKSADAKAVGDALAKKSDSGHTHLYAGANTAGGTALSVNGLRFALTKTDPGVGSTLASGTVLLVYE